MLLTCKILTDVGDVNTFSYINRLLMNEGDSLYVYFQLVDGAANNRRYMPAVGATLTVTLDNLNDAKKLTKTAVQPFALDASIWRIQIASTDAVRGTVNFKLTLTEGAVVTHGTLAAAIGCNTTNNFA